MEHILESIEASLQTNHIKEASSLINEHRRLFENNARFWNLKGVLHYSKQELDMAVQCLTTAVRLDPGYPDAKINLEFISQLQQGEGGIRSDALDDSGFIQRKVESLNQAVLLVESCVAMLHEEETDDAWRQVLTRTYTTMNWSSADLTRLQQLVSSRFLIRIYENILLCIEETLNYSQVTNKDELIMVVEFTLLSLLKELREEVHFFGQIYPDPNKWDSYYRDEFNSANLNIYAKRSMESGVYKYPISIVVPAYNKLEFTKQCVESILKYTQDFEFELILVNDGSTDGTKEYYASIKHPNKKVINLYKNTGAMNAYFIGTRAVEGRVLVSVSNDVIVLNNWLSNLMTCLESDPTIGMVVPMTNKISNKQSINVTYESHEEMQQFAAAFNHSDPNKWMERERLCPFLHVVPMDIFGKGLCHDRLYQHAEFCDDDISLLLRKSGYKLILAGDTYCHHYGSVSLREGQKDNNSLNVSREIFKQKHKIDPWNDIIDGVDYLYSGFELREKASVRLLSLDPGFGKVPYAIRNHYKNAGILDVQLVNAVFDRTFATVYEQFHDPFIFVQSIHELVQEVSGHRYDHILLCKPLEYYDEIEQLIRSINKLLTEDGEFRFVVSNPYSANVISNLIALNGTWFNGGIERKLMSFSTVEKLLKEEGFGTISVEAIPSKGNNEIVISELKNTASKIGVKIHAKHDLLLGSDTIMFSVKR
ncbi:glycosyltransferase [Paenibacillus sp. MMS18-CY102]|uniref:glycosyltransferase n=1 Tax=Paenibacillus sp. MMS18-CY102 TaxID=2682849 RepID=UPI0013653198|nr:glycosyltransferase [Paenibacillus sp. MMS18-CY102]MWC30899.1 glycosyltransferase [Paenibacillus sp. MMS18-CY102]